VAGFLGRAPFRRGLDFATWEGNNPRQLGIPGTQYQYWQDGYVRRNTAKEEAERIIREGKLALLEQLFPGGFGTLAAEVRSW